MEKSERLQIRISPELKLEKRRPMSTTIKELRKLTGMTRPQFCEYLNIPYRTMQDWELGNRTCPDYLITLIEYKLTREGLLKGE